MTELATALAVRDAVRRGELSATEACQAALDRIGRVDDVLHAFHQVDEERALARARQLDESGATDGALHGVPVALKDNIVARGQVCTAGSKMLERFVSPFDATVVERLERAGAVIVGRTICDEFAMGSSTENSAFGPSRNPWDPGRTPGGSSGGSAVAVAAGMTPLALGSDTGGSVRQPAAFCGVVGIKPTWGRVSRYGLVAFASSLDQIGPLARSVEDAALCLEVIAGADPRDATSSARPVPHWSHGLDRDMRGLRIGIPWSLLEDGVDDGVMAAFEASLRELEQLGASLETVDLPHSRFAIPVYYLVATAEASANLARFDGVRYGARSDAATIGEMYDRTRSAGFGDEVKRRIMLGTYVLSAGYYDAYYVKAQQVRALISRDLAAALDRNDVVALPTTPTPAFRFGERTSDPLQMYLADVFTVGASLAGLPAISVPCGLASGLPVGLQLVGRAWDEATLFAVAAAFDRVAHWTSHRPDERA
jgi:aspartyl-tRNA(Asn)/glutamyl-tRNA(Gln) amidotransferase subunit A